VNADAETLGAGDDAEVLAALAPPLELEAELELEDELPQAETAILAVIASATKTVLLLSKCTVNSSLYFGTQQRRRLTTERGPFGGCHNEPI
jgi:hypothetical protein